jgi:hypothetical protein
VPSVNPYLTESHGFCACEPGTDRLNAGALKRFLHCMHPFSLTRARSFLPRRSLWPFPSIGPRPSLGKHRRCFQGFPFDSLIDGVDPPFHFRGPLCLCDARELCACIRTDTVRGLGPRFWQVVGARLFGRTWIRCSHIPSVEITSRYSPLLRARTDSHATRPPLSRISFSSLCLDVFVLFVGFKFPLPLRSTVKLCFWPLALNMFPFLAIIFYAMY